MSHADAALIGILSATPDAAWDIDWHLVKGVSAKRGAQRGVSFDTALRGGIERTEWHLSR